MSSITAKKLSFLLPFGLKEFLKRRVFDSRVFSYVYTKKVIHGINSRSWKFPKVVYLESTNACNANCIMCPREEMTRKTGFMDFATYKKLVDECVKMDVEEIRLHNFGEPLLDSKIVDKIRYAKKKGIPRVGFYTNGQLLDEKLSRDLINSGLDELYISFDAATKETYSKIRRGLDFDVVKVNIDNLLKIRREKNSKKPRVIIALSVMELNMSEIDSVKSEWKDKVDAIITYGLHDWSGQKPIKTTKHRFKHRWPCVYLWKAMFVLWDGSVTICCEDFDGKVTLGNVKDSSLGDIWNNTGYMRIRSCHIKHELHKIPICNTCPLNLMWSIYG